MPAAFALRDYHCRKWAAIYHDDSTILPPPRLTADELDAAYRAAIHNPAVHAALDARQADKSDRSFDSAGRRLPDLAGRAKLGRRSSWLRRL